MIPANRFIAQSDDRDTWLAARATGVTATEVAKASTPQGFADALDARTNPVDIIPNGYMTFGNESERGIMRHAHQHHGILPNNWLLAGENPRHLATPDGLSLDHLLIAEAKTTGKDWATIPIAYRRQVQWQLHISGAERCLFLWTLRVEDNNGWYFTPWLEPKTLWVERDPKMIAELTEVAGRLLGDN